MKQFSLEEFKKNPNRKVVTRKGQSVRIIYTDAVGRSPIVGLINLGDKEIVDQFMEDGSWFNNRVNYDRDLFFAPEKKEGWVNLYRRNEDIIITGDLVLKTKEEAIKCISSEDYIATIHIEWEE